LKYYLPIVAEIETSVLLPKDYVLSPVENNVLPPLEGEVWMTIGEQQPVSWQLPVSRRVGRLWTACAWRWSVHLQSVRWSRVVGCWWSPLYWWVPLCGGCQVVQDQCFSV